MTLFPEMIEDATKVSILGRAINNNLISINAVNIRDFSENKHMKVDDYPYGGGAGMVMQAMPIYKAYQSIIDDINALNINNKSVKANNISTCNINNNSINTINNIDSNISSSIKKRPRVLYMTPQGKVFNQKMAEELAKEDELIFLCGHYEGIDERVLEEIVTDNISIGDFVLTGGEMPAMMMIDALSRLVPGVLHNDVSAEFESFHDNLLEYPQYSRPEEVLGRKVPEVLLSGHHGNIEKWRREQAIIRTYERRPDMLEKANLTEKEKSFLDKYIKENGKNY